MPIVLDALLSLPSIAPAEPADPVPWVRLTWVVQAYASWSPDGRQIAYASGPGGRSPHRIWILDADGSRKRKLTDVSPVLDHVHDTQPAFSRDGTRLAITRYRPGARESSETCVLDLRGA